MSNKNEIIFSPTLNVTKIRLSPNGDARNVHLEVFTCSPAGKNIAFTRHVYHAVFLVTTSTTPATTPAMNTSQCSIQQLEKAPLKAQGDQCVSRESFPRERCGGYCNPADDQCKCCSVGTTSLQAILFDCAVNGSKTETEEKIIQIRRIQSCSCNVCREGCSVRQFDKAPLKINQDQCVSRENIPKERCGGNCRSDSSDQCTCCSISKTYLQPFVFDCSVNGARNVTEQKTVNIQRIQTCNCNACTKGTSNNGN